MGTKTCGNCAATQPFNETHVTCLNMKCKSCNCLKAKTSGGCKCWCDAVTWAGNGSLAGNGEVAK